MPRVSLSFHNTPQRYEKFLESIDEDSADRVRNACPEIDFIVKNLTVNSINAIAIHGGLTQSKRAKTMEIFNNAKAGVLVCTDVAARGLHIENVSHIYNYDIPKDAKDYVHRIGRTARAGKEGKAVNILADVDYDNFSSVLREYPDFKINCEKRPFIKKIIAVREFNRRRNFSRGRNPRRGNYRARPN